MPKLEEIAKTNAKSDDVSTKLREKGNKLWLARNCDEAMQLFTAALFSASTDGVKALALGNRSCVLFHLKCFAEAARDVSDALKVS